MKHPLIASLLTFATISLQATAAVVDYFSGAPISSSGYYQYHTKWVTTTCYHTITKTKDCSYDGGDFIGDYKTVGDYNTVRPQVYPGQDYNDYKTVYETVYEKPHPYPSEIAHSYGTAQPYPYETVCYPETVYSTVYPELSDIVYHTFTASGMGETVSGSPVYHTLDSTVMETVTATPSGVSECSSSGWVLNPTFEEDAWPGPWFQSGLVVLAWEFMPDGSPHSIARFFSGSQLDQAITIPNNREYALHVRYMSGVTSNDRGPWSVVISLGSYVSRTLTLAFGPWDEITVDLGRLSGPSDCVPVVLSIKVDYDGDDGSQALELSLVELLIAP